MCSLKTNCLLPPSIQVIIEITTWLTFLVQMAMFLFLIILLVNYNILKAEMYDSINQFQAEMNK